MKQRISASSSRSRPRHTGHQERDPSRSRFHRHRRDTRRRDHRLGQAAWHRFDMDIYDEECISRSEDRSNARRFHPARRRPGTNPARELHQSREGGVKMSSARPGRVSLPAAAGKQFAFMVKYGMTRCSNPVRHTNGRRSPRPFERNRIHQAGKYADLICRRRRSAQRHRPFGKCRDSS